MSAAYEYFGGKTEIKTVTLIVTSVRQARITYYRDFRLSGQLFLSPAFSNRPCMF
jgi:hypothetical protein